MTNEDKQRIEHRDKWSPVQVLQERKNQIDKYIARMDKVGTSGAFYDSYVLLSRDFNQAISELEHSEKLLQEYREVIRELLPIAERSSITVDNPDWKQRLEDKRQVIERAKSLIEPKTDKA